LGSAETALGQSPVTNNPEAKTTVITPDSLNTAKTSTLSDTLKVKPDEPDSLFYSADSIYFHYGTEQIYLYGDTSVKYNTSTILADSLQIDLKKERAFSTGRTVMIDNDQVLIGNQVYYDVNSQTGMIFDGASKIEKGYYYGDEIRRIDANVYDVDGGRFTTCDDPNPDFWFWSKQMRMYRSDKVVGKPVIAYVNHMPIFYFPFMTFSVKRGRQAGFLMPEPGYNTVDGKFIKDIAYFIPYKDYADATFGLDLMERTGWMANLEARYTKRYYYNGNLDTSLQKSISGNTTNTDYSVRANHHHELGNRATFDANIDYVSNKRIWEGSTDIDQSLAERVTSSISYRKPILSSYFNAGATYSEDLINNTAFVNLPTASYSLPTRPIYELFTDKENTSIKSNWWTNFNYSYYVRLDHTGNLKDKDRSFSDLIWDNTRDSTDSYFLNEHHLGIKHSMGVNYNYKALGWLNLTQGFNYNEAWMDRDRNDVNWVRGSDYNTSTGANFTIYGIRDIPNFYISTIRHIITPSASFGYSPGFKENQKYYNFGGIGLNSGGKSRYISLGLDQKWQIKLKATEKLKERKLNDIFSWTARTGVNLEKDKKQVADFTHNFSFRPAGIERGKLKTAYSASYNVTQNPYLLHWLDWKTKSQYFSHTINVTGNASYTDYFPRKHNDSFASYLSQTDKTNDTASQNLQSTDESWSMSLSQDMSTDKILWHPKYNNLRYNANIKVTTNWSLAYSNYYNVTNSEMLSQSYDISRTLHCWKLNISYTRRNDYWDYRIVFFNTNLPDALKFQTRDNKRTY
jgi:lipopolysaccharide assembly outer membrane protein LptD (OstA)